MLVCLFDFGANWASGYDSQYGFYQCREIIHSTKYQCIDWTMDAFWYPI